MRPLAVRPISCSMALQILLRQLQTRRARCPRMNPPMLVPMLAPVLTPVLAPVLTMTPRALPRRPMARTKMMVRQTPNRHLPMKPEKRPR